jgi:hypothetical protein
VDEAAVLALVAERLAMGRRAYGELRPATDPRSFEREALEEAADGLVYVAAALVRSGKPWGAPSAPVGRMVGVERESP